MEPSDNELIAASTSDPARFGSIFERHHGAIRAYLRGRVDAPTAAELAAETFVRAFRARASYDTQRESARAWLFGIATNLLRQHWRGERRQLRAYARTGTDPLTPETEAVDSRVDAARAGPELAGALAALPRAERDTLLLNAWADLSHEEIASALDVPIGTVRSRLSRARRHMRERISASGIEDSGAVRDAGKEG